MDILTSIKNGIASGQSAKAVLRDAFGNRSQHEINEYHALANLHGESEAINALADMAGFKIPDPAIASENEDTFVPPRPETAVTITAPETGPINAIAGGASTLPPEPVVSSPSPEVIAAEAMNAAPSDTSMQGMHIRLIALEQKMAEFESKTDALAEQIAQKAHSFFDKLIGKV